MKKLFVLVIAALLLIGCSQSFTGDSTINFNQDHEITYTLGEEEFEFNIPIITHHETQEETLAYSLSPESELNRSIEVNTSNLYKEDDVSLATKDELYKIALYGFGQPDDFDFSDESELRLYLATQELLWETFDSEIDVTFNHNIEAQKQQILNDIESFDDVPHFGGSVITVTESDITNQTVYTLTDQNEVLNQFELQLPEQFELVEPEETMDDHTIMVRLLEYTDDLSINFTRPSTLPTGNSLIYTDKDDNTFVSFGDDRLAALSYRLYFEMNQNLIGATLTIQNYDVENVNTLLYGGEFEIADNEEFTRNTVLTSPSQEGSHAKITNIASETIYLRQVKAPAGYELSDEIKEINIPRGVTKTTITFGNQVALPNEEE